MLKPGYGGTDMCGLRGPCRLPAPGFVAGPNSWPQPGGPGSPVAITYGFINYTGDLPVRLQRAILRDAFGRWAAVAPLHFAEVEDSGLPWDDPAAAAPDIRIGWFSGPHGDGYDFDGANGVLAHAFFPPPNGLTGAGDVHFDDAETWASTPAAGAYDLLEVAVHEIGHSLGLSHELVLPAVMQPHYTGQFSGLLQDDIDGVRSLYGPGQGSVSPLPFPAPFDGDMDWMLGISEVLSYAVAYLTASVWPAQGRVPTADYVLRAAAIVLASVDGGYADVGGEEPQNWVPS
jgi:hypothetical protein